MARHKRKPRQLNDQAAWQMGYKAGKTDQPGDIPPGLEDEQAFISGYCTKTARARFFCAKVKTEPKPHVLSPI